MSDFVIHVQVHDSFSGQVNEAALRRAARSALVTAQATAPAALTVVITDTQTVQTLNAQHRGKYAPTDVLSYPAEQDPTTLEPDEPPYLGDVLIALPVAEQQARDAGHSRQDELNLLTVHGVLHLLGYDHETPDDQAQMWAAQSAALDGLQEGSG
jgi:probable rRNA maturation factor